MASPRLRKTHSILRWVFTIAVGLIYVMMGVQKFDPGGFWTAAFHDWGFSPGFRLLIGALEVAGGIALFVPRVAPYAAGALIVVMLGAGWVRVSDGSWGDTIAVGVYILLLTWIGLTRLRDRASDGGADA